MALFNFWPVNWRPAWAAAALMCVCVAVLAKDTPSNMEPQGVDPLLAPRLAMANGSWESAIALLQSAQQSGLDSADLHNLLGYSHRKKSPPDLDLAFHHYRLALQRDPAHQGALEYLGEAHLMARQPEQARRLLDTLRLVCGGTDCEAYQDLRRAIEAYR
jgi:Flp pilus assembly protein TadD